MDLIINEAREELITPGSSLSLDATTTPYVARQWWQFYGSRTMKNWCTVHAQTGAEEQAMRSLNVCFPFVGNDVGGSHLSVAELVEALPGDAVNPIVVLHEPGRLAAYLEKRGLRHADAPAVAPVGNANPLAQSLAMARCAPPLARFLRRYSIDIVHTNDAHMNLTWGPAARLAGCCFVWHQRSADNSRRNGFYSRLAHRVLTVSNYCRGGIPATMAARTTVVADPFKTDAPPPDRAAARRALLAACGAPADARMIGYVSNLTEQKRPLIFVEAAERLRSLSAQTLRFVMFGEAREPMAARLDAHLDALGLRPHCHLMGPRYPIEPWMAGCDLLLAPAVKEGLGRTLVEAMLVGTPVIAADDAGHREIVHDGQTGVLVSPDDPDAFAAAAAQLLAGDTRARNLAAAANASVKRRFSARDHAQRILDIYRGLYS